MIKFVAQCGASVFAQQELSTQYAGAGSDIVWTGKDGRATLGQDIELLFQLEQAVKG
jgi:hypothetical protein